MPSRRPPAAVTLDGNGTLLELCDPTAGLGRELAARGERRTSTEIRRAFAAEVAHYVPRAHGGRDVASLAALRLSSVQVFLDELRAPVPAEEFVPAFLSSIAFRAAEGAPAALDRLRGRGLRLACVANWDVTLADHLRAAGLRSRLDVVVSSAEAGAPKPDPAPFRLALARLGVAAEDAVHVGDEEADRAGARAAGLDFAEPPVATLPARLGLQ
ncbi:MAG: HAD-IA family hydrolase [Thermoleophilia bacterium]|nr:HAD-IA family hydrolase [Thermoleophilia bacterium]